jgi:hypothetical protein
MRLLILHAAVACMKFRLPGLSDTDTQLPTTPPLTVNPATSLGSSSLNNLYVKPDLEGIELIDYHDSPPNGHLLCKGKFHEKYQTDRIG